MSHSHPPKQTNWVLMKYERMQIQIYWEMIFMINFSFCTYNNTIDYLDLWIMAERNNRLQLRGGVNACRDGGQWRERLCRIFVYQTVLTPACVINKFGVCINLKFLKWGYIIETIQNLTIIQLKKFKIEISFNYIFFLDGPRQSFFFWKGPKTKLD